MWMCKEFSSITGQKYMFFFDDEKYTTKLQQKSALRRCVQNSSFTIDRGFVLEKSMSDCISIAVQEIVKQEITRFAEKFGSHIAGHSDYHGDKILSALYCLAEGKEIDDIKPNN